MNAPIHAALLAAQAQMSAAPQRIQPVVLVNLNEHQEQQLADRLHDASDEKFAAQRSAIIDGDQVEAEYACTGLIEDLIGTQQLRDLARTALSGAVELTGREFTRLLILSMEGEALEQAKQELAAAARYAADDPENYRATTHAQDLLREKLQV